MSIKRLIKGLLLTYGAVTLIERHGDDVAKWLEKKAAEIGRKAGEKYVNSDNSIYEFAKAYYADLKDGDIYFTKVGTKDNFDLLSYEFSSATVDFHNFEKYDCYILTARGD